RIELPARTNDANRATTAESGTHFDSTQSPNPCQVFPRPLEIKGVVYAGAGMKSGGMAYASNWCRKWLTGNRY
ncbi:hypothetical protein, partial [Corynebacterium marquesiae]